MQKGRQPTLKIEENWRASHFPELLLELSAQPSGVSTLSLCIKQGKREIIPAAWYVIIFLEQKRIFLGMDLH
jgi:hypothetical protein